jgi:hypothetical protein
VKGKRSSPLQPFKKAIDPSKIAKTKAGLIKVRLLLYLENPAIVAGFRKGLPLRQLQKTPDVFIAQA